MYIQSTSSEFDRLRALKSYFILDTPYEEEFDCLTKLASRICNTPVAYVSLIDEDRQWFKSRIGFDFEEFNKEFSFCQYTLKKGSLLNIEDTIEEANVKSLALVKDMKVRFYAGCPLIDPNGFIIGTLCVLDFQPKILNEDQKFTQEVLANEIMQKIIARKERKELQKYEELFEISSSLI
jgi:GAF domain-containing protein